LTKHNRPYFKPRRIGPGRRIQMLSIFHLVPTSL
jgi:hypothetical protein